MRPSSTLNTAIDNFKQEVIENKNPAKRAGFFMLKFSFLLFAKCKNQRNV